MAIWKKTQKLGAFDSRSLKERKRAPRIANMIVLSVGLFLGSSLVLAAWTYVPEISRAQGEITPSENYRQIEAPETGIVLDVLAREGDQVQAGEVLATLASTSLDRELDQNTQEYTSISLTIARHTRIIEAIEGWDPGNPAGLILPTDANFVRATLSVFQAQQQIDMDVIRKLEGVLEEQRKAILAAEQRVAEKSERLAELKLQQDRGLTTRQVVDAAQDAVAAAIEQRRDLKLRIADGQKEIAVLQAKLEQDALALSKTHIEARFDMLKQLDALLSDKRNLEARATGLEITAPEAGTIHSVSFPNPGEVIEPGETLFELLPAGEAMVATVRLAPREIGHVAVGMTVQLKPETYDNRRFLPIEGEIQSISPNLVLDDVTGEDYFRAIISLNDTVVRGGGLEKPIIAGMKVTSEVVTRERSMLAYILKPLERSLSYAFTER